MPGTDFTLQILRTVVTLVTVLCYTVTSCFVIARSTSALTAALPLPLLAVLYLNLDRRAPPRPAPVARSSWGTATGDTDGRWEDLARSVGSLQAEVQKK